MKTKSVKLERCYFVLEIMHGSRQHYSTVNFLYTCPEVYSCTTSSLISKSLKLCVDRNTANTPVYCTCALSEKNVYE